MKSRLGTILIKLNGIVNTQTFGTAFNRRDSETNTTIIKAMCVIFGRHGYDYVKIYLRLQKASVWGLSARKPSCRAT